MPQTTSMKRRRKDDTPKKATKVKRPETSHDTTTPHTDKSKRHNDTLTNQNTCTNKHILEKRAPYPVTLSSDNSSIKIHVNVLQYYISRGDHTSSTQSVIIRNSKSPKNGKKHNRTPKGVIPPRTNATNQSNICSSGLDAGAPLSHPLTEMSSFRNQITKAERRQSSRGPVPTPKPKWIAQTKQCRETEDVHGTRGQLPMPEDAKMASLDIRSGIDRPTNTPQGASPPTSKKNTVSRISTEQPEKHRHLEGNHKTINR
jgi:hypothetical protein